jgi:hypothetical protein
MTFEGGGVSGWSLSGINVDEALLAKNYHFIDLRILTGHSTSPA